MRKRDLRRGIRLKVSSRRGEVISICRKRVDVTVRRLVYMPFFDAAQLVNNLTLDATTRSKETDFARRRCRRRCNALASRTAKLKMAAAASCVMLCVHCGRLAAVGVALLGLQQQTARGNGRAAASARALNERPAPACAAGSVFRRVHTTR